ncbi:MAG: hypothetical protein RIS52_1233 [Pseudomonadota bacterium]|jgi:hypothetical protein
MKVTRRAALKSGAVAFAMAASAKGLTAGAPALLVYDSRLAPSRAFARKAADKKIDIAHQDADFWRALRAAPAGQVVGLTLWSDWVIVRGFLEEQRKRVRHEAQIGAHALFEWSME